MNKTKLSFGIAGIAGAFVFVLLSLIAILSTESFSFLNGFMSELGKYSGGYLSSSPALTFNIGLALSGLLLSVFMIGFGIQKGTLPYIITAFFGILTGVLIFALSIFTLNYASLHYTINVVTFISAFVTCTMYIISSFIGGSMKNVSLVKTILAFLGGAASIAFAIYVQIGNMPSLLGLNTAMRPVAVPFALIEWAALIIILALVCLVSIDMITKDEEYSTSAPSEKASKTKTGNQNNRNIEF